MVNKTIFVVSFIFAISCIVADNFVFAQSQSPCSGSANITDTSQAQPGVLLVITNSAQAAFTITGPATYQGSGFVWAQQNIPTGTYTITWKPVLGCTIPSPETKATDSKGSIAFAGNYKEVSSAPKKQTGTINVNISAPLKADFTISGPETRTVTAASSFLWPYAPVGTYTIAYGKADGGSVYGNKFLLPPPETKILRPDDTIEFRGTYTELKTKVEATPKISTPIPLPAKLSPSPYPVGKSKIEQREQVQMREQVSQPPKNFFGRVKYKISLFFSNLFSKKPITRPVRSTEQ